MIPFRELSFTCSTTSKSKSVAFEGRHADALITDKDRETQRQPAILFSEINGLISTDKYSVRTITNRTRLKRVVENMILSMLLIHPLRTVASALRPAGTHTVGE